MKEITLKNYSVKIYEHSDEMPIHLFNLSNDYALLDSDVGNTPEAQRRHFERMNLFHAQQNWDALAVERKNIHMSFQATTNHLNFMGLQFACYLYSVKDVEVKDYSVENLKRLLDQLSKDGLTMGMVRDALMDVKKKSLKS
jgi:hypothetical protein